MSLEEEIRSNTAALIELTKAVQELVSQFSQSTETDQTGEKESAKSYHPHGVPLAVMKEEIENWKGDAVTYAATKALIQELAPAHREGIKELNKKYGLKVFADILTDPKDPESPVADEGLLKKYHNDLMELQHSSGE